MAIERILLRPSEAFEAIGVSRSKGYELLAKGLIQSIRIGRCIRIPAGALLQFVTNQLAEQEADT